MVDSEDVRAMKELRRLGWGFKSIARELGLRRATVKRYLTGGVDAKLVRELATGRFIANADNVLLFGPPGAGKTHLAIALGRAAVETGHSVLFAGATALLAALAKAESEGQLADKITFFCKPKLLVVDELGYLPFERRSAHLFLKLVSRLAAAILDRLLHHSHTMVIQGESTD